jgi:hypothetical protein
METITFAQEEDGRWYAEIPTYPGPKADLEMVEGADKMLEIYAQGEQRITLTLSNCPFRGLKDEITFVRPHELEDPALDGQPFGVYYKVSTIRQIPFDFEIWLCPVTTFVFGDYPDKIFIA